MSPVQIGAELARRCVDLDGKAVSQAMWAYAEAGHYHPDFFLEVSQTTLQQAESPKYHARDIASIAWAFGALQIASPEATEALAYLGLLTVRQQSPEGLSKTVWAMARLKYADVDFLDEVGEYMTKRALEFTNEDLVSAVWGMVSLGGVERKALFLKLAE